MSTPSFPQCHSDHQDQTAFPLESLTDHQRKVFTEFTNVKKETNSNIREPIWFALVLCGQKPATMISSLESSEREASTFLTPKMIVEAFNLSYHELFDGKFLVTRSPWRLELIPSRMEDISVTAYFRRMGCFFGYPEQDVKHFIETMGWDTHPTELAEEGTIQPEEAAYMMLLPQRYDVVAHYDRAIASGKHIREIISNCTERWSINRLDEYADWVYHKKLEHCTS